MSLPVIFRSSALVDIDQAYRWYESKQPDLGALFMAELERTEAVIKANPRLFTTVRGEVRRAILHKFPYGLFYIVRPEFISVVAVMHHFRSPKRWQSWAK